MRHTLSAWGHFNRRGGRDGVTPLGLTGYVMVQDDDTPLEAICRSISRRTGLVMVTCRLDSSCGPANDRHQHYQATLGKPVSAGGYSVEAEIWFVVHPDRGQKA